MKQDEHKEQVALFNWASMASQAHPELTLMFAIPNGGHRHKAVAARMKAEGVRAGVPDICLPVARSGHHGMYIEMKTEQGRVSKEQKVWLSELQKQGYVVAICRSWIAAKNLIEDYLKNQMEKAA